MSTFQEATKRSFANVENKALAITSGIANRQQTRCIFILCLLGLIAVVYLMVSSFWVLDRETVVSKLSYIAAVATIGFYVSPLPSILAARSFGSPEKLSHKVYVTTICNCTIWFMYGVSHFSGVLMLVNTVGIFASFFYLYTYYELSNPNQTKMDMQFMIRYLIPFTVGLLLLSLMAGFLVGLIGVAASILMYGAPFQKLALVVRTKQIELLNVPHSTMSFVNTLLWTWLGLLLPDLFIVIPNAVGLALASLQIVVMAWGFDLIPFKMPSCIEKLAAYWPQSAFRDVQVGETTALI